MKKASPKRGFVGIIDHLADGYTIIAADASLGIG